MEKGLYKEIKENDREVVDYGIQSPMLYYEKLLCCFVGPFGKTSHFLFCAFLLIFFHLLGGIMQESVFGSNELNKHGFFLTAILLFMNFSLASIETFYTNKFTFPSFKCSRKVLLLMGILLAGSAGLSNYSLRYLNYTAQVMFKCCKPIPVLLGGFIIQKKIFTKTKILSCVLITVGIVWFSVADAKISPTFQPIGVYVICSALVIDAISPNVLEWALKTYQCHIIETLMYPYLIGSISMIFVEICMRDFIPAINAIMKNPLSIVGRCVAQSICNYIGGYYVISIMKHFGALESSLVTNFRKLVTISISYSYFKKPFTIQFVYSGSLVFIGLFIQTFEFEDITRNIKQCIEYSKKSTKRFKRYLSKLRIHKNKQTNTIV